MCCCVPLHLCSRCWVAVHAQVRSPYIAWAWLLTGCVRNLVADAVQMLPGRGVCWLCEGVI